MTDEITCCPHCGNELECLMDTTSIPDAIYVCFGCRRAFKIYQMVKQVEP